jgi:hypothetical protein
LAPGKQAQRGDGHQDVTGHGNTLPERIDPARIKRLIWGEVKWVGVGDAEGGEVVAEGTPDDVAEEPRSYTGRYLAPMLERAREAAE